MRHTVTLERQPVNRVKFHNGARIILSPDKKVYITTDGASIAKRFEALFKEQGVDTAFMDINDPDTVSEDAAGLVIIPMDQGACRFVDEINKNTGKDVEVVLGGELPKREEVDPSVEEPAPLPAKNDFSTAFKQTVCLDTYPVLASHMIEDTPVVPFALMAEWFATVPSTQARDSTFPRPLLPGPGLPRLPGAGILYPDHPVLCSANP